MNRNLIRLSIAFLIASCTNELPLDLEDKPSKFIINTLLETDKSENIIILGLTGKESVTYISDATVNIYINGIIKETITHSSEKNGTFKSFASFKVGDEIKVEAITGDGLYRAWGDVKVPKPLLIERIDTSSIEINSVISQYRLIRINTTFSDNSASMNYYRIAINRVQKVDAISPFTGNDTTFVKTTPEELIIREDVVLTDGRPTPINSDDSNILNPVENKYGVFDNSRIKGSYTMTTAVVDYAGYYDGIFNQIKKVETTLIVKLQSISQAQFYYLKALNTFDSDNYDDKFSPPVKFPSNVNAGIGIIGVSTENKVSIKLSDYNY